MMRLHSLLLYLYPSSFRAEYAAELAHVFHKRREQASNPIEVAFLWIREFFDVLFIGPVPEAGQVAVCPTLSCVLCGGLAIHLEDATSVFSDQSAYEVNIIYLDSGGSGLHGLIDALQYSGDEAFCIP